jgi:hypothetical protein
VTPAADPERVARRTSSSRLCAVIVAAGIVGGLSAVDAGVAAAAAQDEQVAVTAAAASVPMGSSLDWTVGYASASDAPVANVKVDVDLKANQTVGGLAGLTPDWSVQYSADGGATFTPNPTGNDDYLRVSTPLLPSRATGRIASIPPPITSMSTAGTSGDGYAPIVVGTRAYMLHHHIGGNNIACVDLLTQEICPDYPKAAGVYLTQMPGVPVVVGGKLWFRVNDAKLGLTCLDPATATLCGRHDFVERPAYIWYNKVDRGSQPVVYGDRIFLVADDHNLYCYDPLASAACPGYPKATVLTGLAPTIPAVAPAGTGWAGQARDVGLIDVGLHGSRLYASLATDWVGDFDKGGEQVAANRTGFLHCIDLATGAACTDWSAPVTVTPTGQDFWAFPVVFRKNAGGERTGVCLGSRLSLTCAGFDKAGLSTIGTPDGMWGVNKLHASSYIVGGLLEAEGATRTYHHRVWHHNSFQCWDWAAMAPCTGTGFDASGVKSNVAPGANGAYGYTTTGTCAWGASDNRVLYAFDTATGDLGCSAQTLQLTVRPADFYCDGKPHPITWDRVKLRDVDLTPNTEFKSVSARVRNTDTGVIVAGPVNLLGTDGSIDLAGVPPSTGELSLELAVETVGTTAWDDGIPPKAELLFVGDPVQTCLTSTVALDCAMSPRTVQIVVTAATTSGTGTSSVTLDPSCGGSLSGTVRLDLNRDGVITGADPPAVGLPLTISHNGTVVATLTTAADGTYTTQLAPPGQYVVKLMLTGSLGSFAPLGDPDAGPADGTATVTVTGGADAAANFAITTRTGTAGAPA